jgi:uncharacterized protein YifE (UPF0438 family)
MTKEQERAIIEANQKATKVGVYDNPINKDMVAVKDQYGSFNGMQANEADAWLNGGADRLNAKALQIAQDNESARMADLEMTRSRDERNDARAERSFATNPQQTLANIQQQNNITSLEQAKNNALANPITDPQKQKVKQNTYDANLQARAAKGQNSRSFAEFLSQRGLASSGVAALGESTFGGQMQSTIGKNKIAENQAYMDIDANEAQRQIVEKQRQDDIAREEARYRDQQTYQQGRDSQADSRYWADYATNNEDRKLDNKINEQTYNTNEARIKQAETDRLKNEFISTIGQYANNFQAQINKLQNDGDTSNDWQIAILANERQGKITEAQNRFQQQGIVTADLAPILGLPAGTMTPQYEQNQKILQAKATETALKAETEMAWDKYKANAPLTAREYQLIGVPQGNKYVPPKNTAPVQKSSSGGNSGYGLNW